MAFWAQGIGRFRIGVYQQRGEVAIVGRFINSRVPTGCAGICRRWWGSWPCCNVAWSWSLGSTGSGKEHHRWHP